MTELAVRCGQLIDGSGRDPIRNVTVRIEDGIITAIGPNIAVPSDAKVIDVPNDTVMPGLIDCHVHLITLAGRNLLQRLRSPYSLSVAEGLKNAETVIRAGFTTIRDLSGLPLGGKMAIDRGLFLGPRTRIAISGLSQTGGHGDQMTLSGVSTSATDPEHPGTVVDGPDEIRKAIRELLRAGADQIKVFASGGVMSDTKSPDESGFSADELLLAAFEAHRAGKPIAAHAIGRTGIRSAVEAGFDSIEHGMYLEESIADEMAKRGTYLVPTLLAPIWVGRRAKDNPNSVPDHMLAKAGEVRLAHEESFRMAHQAGVRIAFGSDTGIVPHGAAGEELELMVANGMSTMDAIVAATRTASELVGVSDSVGLLAVGMRADMLLVDGDPLDDIAVLGHRAQIRAVVKDGVILPDAA